MSLLPAEVQGALQQLLQALSSTDNTIRSQAEDQLNNDWTANRADVLLMGLAEQIQNAQDTQVVKVSNSAATKSDPDSCDPLLQYCFEGKPRNRRKVLLANRKSCSCFSVPMRDWQFARSYWNVLQESRSTTSGIRSAMLLPKSRGSILITVRSCRPKVTARLITTK